MWWHSTTELSDCFATQSAIPSIRNTDMPYVLSIFLQSFRRKNAYAAIVAGA